MIFLTANTLGYRVIKHIQNIVRVDAIIALDEESHIVMYDYCPSESFREFCPKNSYKIKSIKDKEFCKILDKFKDEYIVVMGWREVIPKEYLDKYKFVGFHPTFLPYGRGPAPIINTILEGVSKSGVTLFHLTSELDAGDIIAQNTFTVFPDDTSTKIYSRVVFLAKMIAETFLPMLENGTAPRTKQDESKAYIFKKPPKDFNRINPDDDITYTERKIRALQFPYNGAYIESKGKKLIIEKVRME